MPLTLLALHGYSQKGSMMRETLAAIEGLSAAADVVCLDAPHPCKPASVERLYAAMGQPIPPPPHLSWWDASDDGSVYHGFEATLDLIRAELGQRECGRVGLIGFSQGAILTGALAMLSAAGELPPLAFAILVAGRIPRAHALAPRFTGEIAVPSLHVIGERDLLTPPPMSHQLAEKFSPATRKVLVWPGPHVVPTRGSAARAIVDYVRGPGFG
jgi:pimeloyl-ACP methyl ester carboxylesterase